MAQNFFGLVSLGLFHPEISGVISPHRIHGTSKFYLHEWLISRVFLMVN